MVPFRPDDLRRLEAFCEVCDKIQQSRFMREAFKQPSHIRIGRTPDGQVFDEYPRYDDDDFRAFITHYRKLRLNNEPTYLLRIMKLLHRNLEDKEVLQGFMREIEEEEKGWWGFWRQIPGDDEKDYLTAARIEELVLNGEVAHINLDKRDQLAAWFGRTGLMKGIAVTNYMSLVLCVVLFARETAKLIRKRGYLTPASYGEATPL